MPSLEKTPTEKSYDGGKIFGGLPFPVPIQEFLADPYPHYERLRSTTPILRHHNDIYVTRYRDIAPILKDERYAQIRPVSPEAKAAQAAWAAQPEPTGGLDKLLHSRRYSEQVPDRWLVNRDPPDHTRLRGLLQPTFSPGQLALLRPRIQALADGLLDAVQDAGRMDGIADFSYPLPVTIISELVGVPPADRAELQRWSRDFANFFDLKLTPVEHERVLMATTGFVEYCRRAVAEQGRRAAAPGLIHSLLGAHAAGGISTDELMANYSFLFFAGYETTTTLIANGLLALLRHPDQMQRLRDDPGLINSAVEEMLRYDTPTQITARVATTEMEVDGFPIHQHDQIYLLLAAANYDPERFAEPNKLDLGRSPNPHLAFGLGIHYCLGAPLARLEAQIAINTIVRRLPNLALDDSVPLEWAPSLRLRRLKALPLRF